LKLLQFLLSHQIHHYRRIYDYTTLITLLN